MAKFDDLLAQAKLKELIGKKPVVVEEPKKKCHPCVWILAIVGFVAAVAGIAYAVYRYFTPDYLEDFEDEDFDDDEEFDDDFFEEDNEETEE